MIVNFGFGYGSIFVVEKVFLSYFEFGIGFNYVDGVYVIGYGWEVLYCLLVVSYDFNLGDIVVYILRILFMRVLCFGLILINLMFWFWCFWVSYFVRNYILMSLLNICEIFGDVIKLFFKLNWFWFFLMVLV